MTCGWSWNAANNPEFRLFVEKFIPGAVVPNCPVLSGAILTGEANKVIARTKAKIEGKLASYAEDGWKNVAHTHVDTSVLSVEGEPYLLRTGRPKTGDELFAIMKSDIEYAWNTYRVEIIAICTDDGPDGKKARRLIREWKGSIAVFECWAHQSNLMTGNYPAIKAVWMLDAKEALMVIKWFNHHGKALDMLRAHQLRSHYCSLRRLLKLERAIRTCVITHRSVLRTCTGQKDEQIAAAEAVLDTVERNSFWKNIARIVVHLEPLAIAANLLRSPHCRLDTVLLTLANLFRIFNNLASEDAIVQSTLHASLERRWGKTDQELMILAVFFNPYIRSRPFSRDALTTNDMFHLGRRAFKHLLGMGANGNIAFGNTFRNYYNSAGQFSAEAMWLERHAASYEKAKKPVDLLAIRILSILPNSAGAERAFSVFGLTPTKHRNRLSPLKVHDATVVRIDRQKADIAKARRFSVADDEPGESGKVANTLISLANADNEDESDDDDQAAPTVIPARPAATGAVPNASGRIPSYKKIKLAVLFNYPPPSSPALEMEFFWQGG
ncbi:ribonuclease H-like domain-containing protein [Mycena galopus ATCC 62051]|nr:ribonuclease H-like domain-containing protein [Mycena galopus ATCC 62051]